MLNWCFSQTQFLCHLPTQFPIVQTWIHSSIVKILQGLSVPAIFVLHLFKGKPEDIWLSKVRGVWWVMRGTGFWVCSRYLVSATPPTVLNQSFWNFICVLIMVWKYACVFYRILFFFSPFFTFLIYTFFFAWFQVCSRYLVSPAPPSFTLILLKLRRCFNHDVKIFACAFYRILRTFFSHSNFNRLFFSGFNTMKVHMQ